MFLAVPFTRLRSGTPQISCGRATENYSACWAGGAMVGYVFCRVNSKKVSEAAKIVSEAAKSLTSGHVYSFVRPRTGQLISLEVWESPRPPAAATVL